jgi:hypothetical protein
VPFVEREPMLFLLASEIIHSKKEMLQFCEFIQIVEIHDFTLLESSNNDSGMDGSDSRADGIPSHDYASGYLRPWPKLYRSIGESSFGEPWPSIPTAGEVLSGRGQR